MKKPVALLLCLLCLAVGATLGYVLKPDAPAPAPVAPAPAVSDPTPPPPAPREAQPVIAGDPSLAGYLDSVAIDATPTGDGRITGAVKLKDGGPLAGVRVKASLSYRRPGAPAPTSLEEEVAALVRRRKWETAAGREAATGADGAYELTGLDPARKYYVWAALEGYELQHASPIGHNAVQAGDVVDFVAIPQAYIDVVLRLPGGEVAPDGMISYAEEGNKSSSGLAYRAPSQRLTLRPGKYVLWAEHGSEREYRSENVTVECVVGKPQNVELQLNAVPAVFGTVTVPAAFAAAHVNVYLAPIGEDGDEPDDGDYHGHGRSGVLDPSTRPRKYRIADIEPGTYRVLARTPIGGEVSQPVEVASGPVRVDLVLPEPRSDEYIIVRAFDPAGEPVTDLQVSVIVISEGSSYGGGTYSNVMPDKSVWIRRRKERPGESWGNWRYQIVVSSPKYVASPIEYGRTDTHEVRINFLDPAFATISATNGDDHRLRKQLTWSIVAPGQAGATERYRREREGEEENKQPGATRLGPFQPGAYELVLMLAESSFDNRELLRMPVTLAAGENALTAMVPELYSLAIVPAPGATLRSVNVAPKGVKTASFAYRTEVKNNRITLDNVPAGEYVLSDNEGHMSVRVPTAGEVVFNPPAYDCSVITGLRPGGKVEAMGFRNGDKVIRIDGSEITSRDVGKALFRLSATKESTTWTMLRNGREVELTFSGKELTNIIGKGAEDRESMNMQSAYRNE